VSVVGTALRRVARRLPAKRSPKSFELMRYWPEMDDSSHPRRLRYALLCLAGTVVMTIVFMAVGIKLIDIKQKLQFQHQSESDAMTINVPNNRTVVDLSSIPATAESSKRATVNALANSGVLKLKASGLSDDLIVQRIKMSPGNYKLDPDDLWALKKVGLSDAVISAMMTATSGQHK
jgi:hypothetical protein